VHIETRVRTEKKTGREVKSFQCHVYHPGLKRRFKKTFPKHGEAKDWGLDLERKIRGGESTERPEDITVEMLSKMYLATLTLERTRKKRKVGVDKWVKALGKNKLVRLVTRIDVKAFVATLAGSGYQQSSIATYLATLKAALNLAVEDGYIKANPAAGRVRGAEKTTATGKDIRSLTMAEHEALMVALDPAYHTLIYVWPRIGLRVGELVALRWTDMDLSTRKLRVERQWQEGEGYCDPKCGSQRTVNLSRQTAQTLREWKLRSAGMSNAEGLVFPGQRGGRIDQKNLRYTILGEAAKKASIEGLTPHVFRHTFGSWLLDGGVRNIGYIAHQLGDTLDVVIKTYLHDRSHEDANTADVLDTLCSPVPTAFPQQEMTAETA
jgi:integrase